MLGAGPSDVENVVEMVGRLAVILMMLAPLQNHRRSSDDQLPCPLGPLG